MFQVLSSQFCSDADLTRGKDQTEDGESIEHTEIQPLSKWTLKLSEFVSSSRNMNFKETDEMCCEKNHNSTLSGEEKRIE